MHAVKLGMTEAEMRRLLGKPDDLDSLPRGSGVDRIFVYRDGRGVVSFNATATHFEREHGRSRGS